MSRKQQPRDVPSQFVVPLEPQILTLPRPGKLDELNSKANELVRQIQFSLRTIIVWSEDTVGLGKHKDRMQSMYETREDAMSLARQQERHEILTAELHRKRAWSLDQHHSEIIDLEHDIKELVSILRFADGDLHAIAGRFVAREGSRFAKVRDWSAQRRNSL